MDAAPCRSTRVAPPDGRRVHTSEVHPGETASPVLGQSPGTNVRVPAGRSQTPRLPPWNLQHGRTEKPAQQRREDAKSTGVQWSRGSSSVTVSLLLSTVPPLLSRTSSLLTTGGQCWPVQVCPPPAEDTQDGSRFSSVRSSVCPCPSLSRSPDCLHVFMYPNQISAVSSKPSVH